MTREKTFLSVYGVEQPKQVLELFTEDVKQVKRVAKTKQYQGLLELVLKYSYAMFYDYKTVSIRNNRLKYRRIAMSELSKKDVERAFDMIAIATEPSEPKPTATKVTPTDCIAIDQIKRLKDQLDNETYQLKRGQKADDTEIYIKVALVAMATGSRLQEIMETLELSQRKGTITFTIDEDSTEGVILELDYKTVRAYLKDIRKYYRAKVENALKSYMKENPADKDLIKRYEKFRETSNVADSKIDISTGIRKAVKRLEIPMLGYYTNKIKLLTQDIDSANVGIKETTDDKRLDALRKRVSKLEGDKKKLEQLSRDKSKHNALNLNSLNDLYLECISGK